jgi:ribonuclease VapC
MLLETSALVAILLNEASAADLSGKLDSADLAVTSPLVVLEATMVLASRWNVSPQNAEREIHHFLDQTGVAMLVIDDTTASLAVQAFQTYGKGRGHPAQLNMGDCFSFACAKQHRVSLLYVGDDFAQTDLA